MVLGIAIVALAVLLSYILVIYSRFMGKTRTRYVESYAPSTHQDAITELPLTRRSGGSPCPPPPCRSGTIDQGIEEAHMIVKLEPDADMVPEPDADMIDDMPMQFLRRPTKSKKYSFLRKVLVNYAESCTINHPIPLIVSLVPNMDELLKEAKARAKVLMPSGTKLDTVQESLFFKAEESDPKIKVELSFPEGTLKADTLKITKRLQQNQITEFQFLITPVLGTHLMILVRVKYVKSADEEIELLVINVPINAKAFGNFDTRQLSVATWILSTFIVLASTSIAILIPDTRIVMPILAALGLIAKPLGSFDLTKLLPSK